MPTHEPGRDIVFFYERPLNTPQYVIHAVQESSEGIYRLSGAALRQLVNQLPEDQDVHMALSATLIKPPNTPEVPIALANRRVLVGPKLGAIAVDNRIVKLQRRQYNLLRHLAENADIIVSPVDAFAGGWGKDKPFRDILLRKVLYEIRNELPTDLASQRTGLIRTAYGKGLMAVTEL